MAVNQQELSDNLKNTQAKPKHPGGRPTKYSDNILRRTKEYLKQSDDKIPTIAGLSVHLGYPRKTIYEWLKRPEADQFRDTVAMMADERERKLINESLAGNYNSAIAKLILMTNHGYSENNQKDTAITVNVDRGRVSITSKDHAISVDTEKDITPGHVIEHE